MIRPSPSMSTGLVNSKRWIELAICSSCFFECVLGLLARGRRSEMLRYVISSFGTVASEWMVKSSEPDAREREAPEYSRNHAHARLTRSEEHTSELQSQS